VLTQSKGAIAASALAIVTVGGSIAVIIHAAAPPSSTVTSPAALPVPVGSAATATMPSGTGAGTGLNGTGSADGGSASAQERSAGAKAAAAALPRSAGQGDPGPLATGSLPADGAVPGALSALQSLAAARAATTALSHSPQLMGEFAGPTPSASPTATAITAPTASASPTASPTATASAAPTLSATPTPTATDTPGSGSATPTPAASPTEATPAPASTPTTTGTGSPAAAEDDAFEVASAASATTRVPGIDVAGFQHANGRDIGWSQVAGAGYRFAAVKGTEGDYYVNPWGTTDLAQAKAAGLDVTPYHFAVPNASSGTEQAEFAVEYSGYATGTQMMPLMLDIEYDPYVATDGTNECYGLTTRQMTAWIAAFATEARSLTGQSPLIYTTANWWDTCTGGSTAFGADPMWVAAYGFARPPMPAGWSAWTFWQYTSGGTVPGVDSPGETDLDSFSPLVVGLIDPGSQASHWRTRVSVPIASLGTLARETLTYSATGLPPGLAIGGGLIAGTPAGTGTELQPRTYQVRLTAKNAAGATSTELFSWQVTPTCARYRANGSCPGA
jgi:GH25 family lysozyme M1 (1,4-beta-N-acetylmuramidase)